jgi:hypothetical protein
MIFFTKDHVVILTLFFWNTKSMSLFEGGPWFHSKIGIAVCVMKRSEQYSCC